MDRNTPAFRPRVRRGSSRSASLASGKDLGYWSDPRCIVASELQQVNFAVTPKALSVGALVLSGTVWLTVRKISLLGFNIIYCNDISFAFCSKIKL